MSGLFPRACAIIVESPVAPSAVGLLDHGETLFVVAVKQMAAGGAKAKK